MTEVEHSQIIRILQSRAHDFPTLSLDMSKLSQSLINLFQALDEKYFELSNSHMLLKQQLQSIKIEVQEVNILKQEKALLFEERDKLQKHASQLTYKVQQLEETNQVMSGRFSESILKIAEQEKLLLSQSEQLLDFSLKCSELQSIKYALEERVKETSHQKQLIEVSLNKQIAEIQVVRDRQKTHINDAAKEIKEYYQQLNILQLDKTNLKEMLSEAQKQLAKLKQDHQAIKKQNEVLQVQNKELRDKCQNLELKSNVLEEKQQQLQQIKIQNINLKEKQGNLDLMLQTLSSEKNKLNSEINRMTIEAKANRKRSDNQSVNTDTAFQHMTESFRYNNFSPTQDLLNKSTHQIKNSEIRKVSLSSSFKINRSHVPEQSISWQQEKIAYLENRKTELERTVRQLRKQLQQKDQKQKSAVELPVVLFQQEPQTIEKHDLVVTNLQQLSISNDDINQRRLSTNNFQVTILPELRLLSLYSIPAVKLKPKVKNQTGVQTQQQKVLIDYSSPKPRTDMNLSFDEVEIQSKKSSASKSESFFDKLSRMFCGGPSL